MTEATVVPMCNQQATAKTPLSVPPIGIVETNFWGNFRRQSVHFARCKNARIKPGRFNFKQIVSNRDANHKKKKAHTKFAELRTSKLQRELQEESNQHL
jgi:hypothetical protein